MGKTAAPQNLSAAVWSAFRRRCHQFIAIAYSQALIRIRKGGHEETDITGYICEALEIWFRKHPRESFVFYVKEDPPVGSGRLSGKRRPRTDIVIGYAAGQRPEFVFECKRLHRQHANVSRYMGEEGLGCFVTSRYATAYREAAMIGYVQSDAASKWQLELQEKVRTNSQELGLQSLEESVKFAEAFTLEWASTHRRRGSIPIRIFHILLDCSKS